jgi:hypothetical protein
VDEIYAAAGHDLAGLDQVIDALGRRHDQVGGRSHLDLDGQYRARQEARFHLVSAVMLENRADGLDEFRHGGASTVISAASAPLAIAAAPKAPATEIATVVATTLAIFISLVPLPLRL